MALLAAITDINYPFGAGKIRKLKAGDRIKLSGRIFTGRDRLHRYLCDGGECPVDLTNGAIFHCGPLAVRKDGRWVIKSAGPTTSSRQNVYTPQIIEKFQLRVIIGKGGMNEATRAACVKFGCIYIQTIGGAGALLASSVKEVKGVHFLKEFGTADALWDIEVEDLPGIVAIDARGRNLYKRVGETSRMVLKKLFKQSVKLG